MFNTRQTILASRPAAMVLALSLVAALTVPALLLPRAHAADDPPLPCTVGNYNGCTELSPTPPQDTVSVPPNLVLMLDDSGSMEYDYMPDWDYLSTPNIWGARDPDVNGVYYNKDTVYTPPPKADGTLYPDSPGLTNAYFNGFTDTSHTRDVRTYQASRDADLDHQFQYGVNLPTTEFTTTTTDKGEAEWGGSSPGGCPSGYYLDPNDSTQCIRDPVSPTEKWTCNSGDTYYASHGGKANQCLHREYTEHGHDDTWYDATDEGPRCPSGSTYDSSDGLCRYAPKAVIPPTPDHWICPNGGSTDSDAPPPPSDPPECIATSNSRIWRWAFVYVVGDPVQANAHFVMPNGPDAPSDGWCAHLYPGKSPYTWNGYSMDTAHCVTATDTFKDVNGKTYLAQDGTTLTVGQNIANWFSYYRTRMLMAKSSLMVAFSNLDQKYRFGFASINGNGKSYIPNDPSYVVFDDASGFAGDQYNRLAVVQPFGLGSDTTSQRSKFWTWLHNESPANGTPLRKALQAVGDYYKTDQPWTTMPGDPGYTATSTTKFACRASYTILMTDGFWNGESPSGDIVGAAGRDGPVQTVPAGHVTQYRKVQPFLGGAADSGASLADVATYYWENDLRTDMPNEGEDPGAWQHMTTFTIGLGFTPPIGPQRDGTNGIMPDGTTIRQIFAWAKDPDNPDLKIDDFSWPTPSSNSIYNIDDLAHAAVNGRGAFFSAKKPEDLVNAFLLALADIAARTVKPTPAAVNASVLSLGAASFSTGYNTKDWSGALEAVTLKTDGTVDQVLWLDGYDPDHSTFTSQVDAAYHSSTGYDDRKVYTGSYSATDGFSAFQFNVANKASLDATETAGLLTPALSATESDDTLDHRIEYLLGDNTYELTGVYRTRSSILGAILRSTPVYVAGATGNYYDSWPAIPGPTGPTAAPESDTAAQTFDAFVTQQATQQPMVYVGANDGMLHAFHAPVPTCSGTLDANGNCSVTYTVPTGAGKEAWAFMPRAVYANLGNLTSATDFHFRPTMDATPVRRDVFFTGDKKWHTILAGGVGLGGRGVYALDVTATDPSTFSESNVLWEFDSDMTPAADCKASYGTCKGTDLGYTLSQPNVGRLSDGKWVVLVANGYFPDCTTPDIPTGDLTSCEAIAAQAPKDSSGKPYSALFVLDAETGKMIAELKTPTDLGVTSFGLASPVLGDYNNDQVDDVAFAGDVQGNLWRFDLSSTDASEWTVTLVYQGISVDGHQGVQPITTMPRLFPDPVTNRFMVVFGTGKFLGVGDNGDGSVQAIYGVRDVEGKTWKQTDLQRQYLHEKTIASDATLPDGDPDPQAGQTLRCVTGDADNDCSDSATAINEVAATEGGWYINLQTTTSDGVVNDAGERVVVDPGAIFASNTVVIETLITGSQSTDACNPTTVGAIMALNANTGGPAGVSSLGGWPTAGGRITNARTSGSLPVVSALGGGQAYLPGAALAPSGNPMSIDAPIWRRRSWQQIRQNP